MRLLIGSVSREDYLGRYCIKYIHCIYPWIYDTSFNSPLTAQQKFYSIVLFISYYRTVAIIAMTT